MKKHHRQELSTLPAEHIRWSRPLPE